MKWGSGVVRLESQEVSCILTRPKGPDLPILHQARAGAALGCTCAGKLAWNGAEGWTLALDLISVAEEVHDALETDLSLQPLSWRRGIIRPPASQRHCDDFVKNVKLASSEHHKVAGLSCVNGSFANILVPGLALSPSDVALHIADGLNINPRLYLQCLWRACELHGMKNVKGSYSHATLKMQHIESLSCLPDQYDAVIVCLGGGITTLPELSGKLPIVLCRGVVLELGLPSGKEESCQYKGPSIVGETWLAAQAADKLILGATKEWNITSTVTEVAHEDAVAACNEMVAKAATFYPPIRNWCMQAARAGLRVMTHRTPYGKIPMVGCIDNIVRDSLHRRFSSPYYWIFGGLGSRGLINHGWLGKKLAKAVVTRSEACLPGELLQWKSQDET